MDYYDRRRKVLEKIEDITLSREFIEMNRLIYAVQKAYGVSALAIKRHLDLLESLGDIKIEKNMVYNLNYKKEKNEPESDV